MGLENYISNTLKSDECGTFILLVPTDEKFKPFPKCSFHICFFRKTLLLKYHLYLVGTDEVCLCFQKYLFGNISHLSKGLQIQNTSFLKKENVELIFMFDR